MGHRTVHSRALAAIALLVGSSVLRGQEIAGGAYLKENLDLPYNAGARAPDEEEDPPEIVTFYGQTYETEAIFFCLDQSLSMGSGEWEALQRELTRVITEFSTSMEFGIVFFHEEATVFPSSRRPAKATPGMKRSAISLVRSTAPSNRSTCFLSGLREALRMANLSSAERRSVVFMSDGKATCIGEDSVTYVQQTLSEVKALNAKRSAINTVGVGFEVIEHFLKSLAEQNGGRYQRLTR